MRLVSCSAAAKYVEALQAEIIQQKAQLTEIEEKEALQKKQMVRQLHAICRCIKVPIFNEPLQELSAHLAKHPRY